MLLFRFKNPSMETFLEFRERVDIIVDWIWKLHKEVLPSRGSKDAIIVAHGNVISAAMARLMKGNGLIVHNNSAFSHMQLFSTPTHGGVDIGILKSMNNSQHLHGHDNILTGADVVGDWWIQEYLQYM